MKFSILEFTVENFKIFKEKTTFSMVHRKNEFKTFGIQNDVNLLRTALIYGANASGKSSLLQAMATMRQFILTSSDSRGEGFPYFPYRLSNGPLTPSFFEIVFTCDSRIFRYNFSVNPNSVLNENLTDETDQQVKNILKRTGQVIDLFEDFKTQSDRDVADQKTKGHVLFLSAAAQWNDGLAESIVESFRLFNVLDGSTGDRYVNYTVSAFKKTPSFKEKILRYLKRADFLIVDGRVEEQPFPDHLKKYLPPSITSVPDYIDAVKFSHNIIDKDKSVVGLAEIDFSEESIGTQRFFTILGPILDTLEHGKVLVIDEFDNSLHPELTKLIVKLFEHENPMNAQLIVTTHDTSLMSRRGHFLRGQIWFAAKSSDGSAEIFSLDDFKDDKLRNDTEFQQKYLEGRFGALPFID